MAAVSLNLTQDLVDALEAREQKDADGRDSRSLSARCLLRAGLLWESVPLALRLRLEAIAAERSVAVGALLRDALEAGLQTVEGRSC